MLNHQECKRQLVDRGIDPDTADKVASAVIATEKGRERSPDEKEAVAKAVNQINGCK